MNTVGLDIDKLKSLAIAKWNSEPELWPFKVISLARLEELERQQGGRKLNSAGGYFTCLRAIRGKTPSEMEAILGFASGFYSSGVSVWRFVSLPAADQFELRGYSQLPGGRPFDGIVHRMPGLARPDYRTKTGEQLKFVPGLAVEQWELRSGFCYLPSKSFNLNLTKGS